MDTYLEVILSALPLLFIFIVIMSILYWVIGWCIQDAKNRGKSPGFVTIAVIVFFPWGLIAWLLFRPDLIELQKEKFKLEDYREQ